MEKPPFESLLVANRGEIALRVLRTAREMGIRTIAVYSDADRTSLHVLRAHEAVRIGPAAPAESYLSIGRILEAARARRAQAVHPGYGFLSENPAFARAVEEAGLVFVGPPPSSMELLGDKLSARRVAREAGVPVVPGRSEEGEDLAALAAQAGELGYPVLIKAAAGGGGRGMRTVASPRELEEAARLAREEARSAFGDARVYLEKLLARPRHVEVQVVAGPDGRVEVYGERECSVQRRHQKLVEESPSPALDEELRAAMAEAACKVAAAAGYRGAGTVEFLLSEGRFYFLEMNARIQVEHPVTEERFRVDLVAEQLRVAAGLPAARPPRPSGHAIEVRVNAEDPDTFFPSLGRVRDVSLPGGPGVRVDTALRPGEEVTAHYDPLLAKVVAWAPTREEALARAERALGELRIAGLSTSVPAALRVLRSRAFRGGDYDTGILEAAGAGEAPGGSDGSAGSADPETLAVAAAAARLLAARGRVPTSSPSVGSQTSPWVQAGRSHLRGRPHGHRD